MLYGAKQSMTILQQFSDANTNEAKYKEVRLVTFFQMLQEDRKMLKYESRHALDKFIEVLDDFVKHWCNSFD